MPMTTAQPVFRLETSIDDRTGRVVAAHLRIRQGDVARTEEVEPGVAYADYDENGLLLGIELLGPCQTALLDRVAQGEAEPVKAFLNDVVPKGLVAA
jgi:hypothetical protein